MEKLLTADFQSARSHRKRQGRTSLADVSVVVPIGPGEDSWRQLLTDLCPLPSGAETLLVATVPQPPVVEEIVEDVEIACEVRWLTTSAGRARQLNIGAEAAKGDYLWLVHADTRVPTEAFTALESCLAQEPNALFYFDLEFRGDGPGGTHWNTRGVRFRSQFLGLPFGDQAFCLRHETFDQLGRFDEQAPYGEDHLLVWAARRGGVPLRRIDATITTSARKYAKAGWLPTTLLHLWRTCRQALPEWWKWVRG